MTTLRLDAISGTAIDRAIAAVGACTLTRRPDGCFVDVPLADVPILARALAFVGIAAIHCDVDDVGPRSLVAAVGTDLRPLPPEVVALDVVRVRRVPLGEATSDVLRRRFAWLRPPSGLARARCRALLSGEDVLLAWDRRAWSSAVAFRDPRARRSLRPVVFDRAALDREERRGRTFVRDGALARWAFG